ncbi:MAG: tetratricopeptide repeat protein [Sphingobacteriaceae bacterium]|nr:tetratricopeptide repeat protein [Sphingobacteriaceae bacterium]
MRSYSFIFLLLLCVNFVFGQDKEVDSVQLILNSHDLDTNDAKIIYRLQLKQINDGDFKSIIKNKTQVLNRTSKLNDQLWYANSMRLVGLALERTGEIDLALKIYADALNIAQTIKRKRLEAQCYHNIGFANYLQSSFDKAIIAYLNAIKIREEIKDSVPLAWTLNNVGLIYWRQHSKNDALKHFVHAQDIFRKKNFLEGLAVSTNNVGLIYDEFGDKIKAKKYYFEAYHLNNKIDNKDGIALALNNLSEIYRLEKKMDTCIQFLNKALEINTEINNLEGLELNYRNLADISREQGDHKKALELIQKAINVSNKGNLPQGLISDYNQLSLIYADMGNYKDAFLAHKYYAKLNDSLNFGDKLASLEAAFGKEKIEKEVALLKNEKEISELQLKRKQWVIYTAIIGIIFLVIVSFFIVRSNINRKKTNLSLELKNNEIIKQKEIIEAKSNDITDSILYAKRIQSAVLPEVIEFKSQFTESFVLFEPRDIVSGDFYWLDRIDDTIVMILADCTGHGVPGAFMSIIGHDLLKQIIKEGKQVNPSLILRELDYKVHQLLNKNTNSNNDGMDIAVVAFDTTTNKGAFCGAGRPLITVDEGKMEIHHGHKFSIGGSSDSSCKLFLNIPFDITPTKKFYLLSDGYSDQFGGEKGKKFKTQRLLQTISTISTLPMQEQKKVLLETFTTWKGQLEQVDDVCVLGIRL